MHFSEEESSFCAYRVVYQKQRTFSICCVKLLLLSNDRVSLDYLGLHLQRNAGITHVHFHQDLLKGFCRVCKIHLL